LCGGTLSIAPSSDACIRYVQSTLWYCQKKSKNLPTLTGLWQVTPGALPPITGFPAGIPDNQKWMCVQALRFLSHAATCLTGWFPISGTPPDLTDGITIPAVSLDGMFSPQLVITNGMIQYYHELAVKLIMTF